MYVRHLFGKHTPLSTLRTTVDPETKTVTGYRIVVECRICDKELP